MKSAPLHDIGKVGIADSILLKPGKLTPEERAEINKHCEYGARVLQIAEKKLPFQSFLAIAIQLTLFHHEKWDGTGYPHGLSGDAIPLSGRIMALADNYDALRTERPYKKAFPHEETRSIIESLRGTHFDPVLVDAFVRREAEFRRVSEELRGLGSSRSRSFSARRPARAGGCPPGRRPRSGSAPGRRVSAPG